MQKGTRVTIDTVAVPIILLNTFCGGGKRAARNKGRDVKYQLQTISPDFLVQALKEKYSKNFLNHVVLMLAS